MTDVRHHDDPAGPDPDAARRAADEEPPAPPGRELAPVPPASGAFGRAVDALGLVFALMFVVSTAIILYEVVMRHVFGAPTAWVHETTTFLCGAAFVFGGLYALARDGHIRVVLLYGAVRGRAKRALDVAISFAGLLTAGFFAYAAWTTAQKALFAPTGEFRLERSGSAWNPPYPALIKAFLLIVTVAMVIQFVVLIVNHARGVGHEPARDVGHDRDPAE